MTFCDVFHKLFVFLAPVCHILWLFPSNVWLFVTFFYLNLYFCDIFFTSLYLFHCSLSLFFTSLSLFVTFFYKFVTLFYHFVTFFHKFIACFLLVCDFCFSFTLICHIFWLFLWYSVTFSHFLSQVCVFFTLVSQFLSLVFTSLWFYYTIF